MPVGTDNPLFCVLIVFSPQNTPFPSTLLEHTLYLYAVSPDRPVKVLDTAGAFISYSTPLKYTVYPAAPSTAPQLTVTEVSVLEALMEAGAAGAVLTVISDE